MMVNACSSRRRLAAVCVVVALWRSTTSSTLLAGGIVDAATIYSVGPSQTFSTIGTALAAGKNLGPGDEVWIYAKATPYFEKFVVNAIGSKDAPIVIKGISVNGVRPIIDGTSAVTATGQDFWNEARGLIKIGAASIPALTATNGVASYIRIENLHLRNARSGLSFSDKSGTSVAYAKNAACLYIEQGTNVELVNNTITGCGNGIFITPGVENVLIEANYIHGNGVVNSILEHNTYTEGLGMIYRYNRFGPLCTGCLGNNLKDRSGALIVAYNLIQGGNRQLDLVDSTDATIFNDARYRTTLVYGNILVEEQGTDNRQIVHYGGDSGNEGRYRKGTLHFYHNTVVSTRTGRTTLIRLSSEAETCDARNNIILVTVAAGSELELLSENRGQLILRHNWFKAGYVTSFETVGTGRVTLTNNINGTNANLFADANFATTLDMRLAQALGPSAALAAGVPMVDREYVRHAQSQPRTSSDIGAYGFATSSPAAQPLPVPPTVAPPSPTSVSPAAAPSPAAVAPTSNAAPTTCASCQWFLMFRGIQLRLQSSSSSTTSGPCREKCVSRRAYQRALLQGWTCGRCS